MIRRWLGRARRSWGCRFLRSGSDSTSSPAGGRTRDSDRPVGWRGGRSRSVGRGRGDVGGACGGWRGGGGRGGRRRGERGTSGESRGCARTESKSLDGQ